MMKEQANTPLELYEKAYRLQYDENKIPEACRLYKAIIDEFPDSNECGYAVIQLEKLIAGAVSEKIVVSSRRNTLLAVLALAVSVISLAGVFLLGNHFAKTINSRLSSLSAVSHAVAFQEAAKAKADEDAVLKKASEEKPVIADTAAAAKPRVQVEPPREKPETQPVREARPKVKKEPAAAPKASRHKAAVPTSHQDSVSFF
jgi:hypothetical protein